MYYISLSSASGYRAGAWFEYIGGTGYLLSDNWNFNMARYLVNLLFILQEFKHFADYFFDAADDFKNIVAKGDIAHASRQCLYGLGFSPYYLMQ